MQKLPGQNPSFHESELKTLKRLLIEKTPLTPGKLAAEQPLLSLDHIMREMRFLSTSGKATFLTDFLAGSLTATARTGDSLKDIFFLKADVIAAAAKSRLQALNGSLNQGEAAAALGCNVGAIRRLHERGFLTGIRNKARYQIDPDSLTEFSAKYVVLGTVTEQFNLTLQALVRICERGSIPILGTAKKYWTVSSFVKRHDISRIAKQSERSRSRSDPANTVTGRLRNYLANLSENRILLPRCNGKPNRLQIANACGINRNALYSNLTAFSMIEEFAVKEVSSLP